MKKTFWFLTFCAPLVCFSQIADSTKREVRLQGAINFRDLGGYQTKDGRMVKWGKIYRSAAISNLTEDDLKKLNSLSIGYVADFRGPFEVKQAPDRVPAGAKYISLPAGSETIGDSTSMRKIMQMATSDSGLTQFYAQLDPFKARYKPVFDQLLSASSDSALLFHCSAGKDRTGIAAAFILYALGVDEKKIMEDYEATNYYRRNENEKSIAAFTKSYNLNENAAKKMMAADPKYLSATFNAARLNYGSIDNYLEKEMGLTAAKRKQLQSKYLE